MYINMYGCKEFDGDVYLNTDDTDDHEWDVLPDFYRCERPEPQFFFSLFFFVSFIVISSLVMLSLFIGVITMSMQDSLNDMRKEVEVSNRKKRLLKAEEEMEKLALKNTAMTIAARMGGTIGSRMQKRQSCFPNGILSLGRRLYVPLRNCLFAAVGMSCDGPKRGRL